MEHIIKYVEPDSIAEELGILPGDQLLCINSQEIKDVLDYRYIEKDEEIELLLYRPSTNEEWEFFVEKEPFESLGIEFETPMMDAYSSCTNKCVFCFIDQLPEGMRETLYFKDDDARLSFLQGNYITMTNLKQDDVDRIVNYRLSPINISIQTMDLELRKEMLHNRFADRIIGYMEQLQEADITMNGQIVLCKGINDKDALKYSIEEASKFLPQLQSMSVVPVGLTKYRENLAKLEAFTKEDAIEIIEMIEAFQQKFYKNFGLHFIHAGDEFYFLAERDVPEAITYDDYLQYENGVGMCRLLKDTFNERFQSYDFSKKDEDVRPYKHVGLVTGKLMAPILDDFADACLKKLDDTAHRIDVFAINNEFFGEKITVSGLITGGDIIKQLPDTKDYDIIYIPDNMLKADEPIFLDDITLDELQSKLECKLQVLPIQGEILFDAILGKEIDYE